MFPTDFNFDEVLTTSLKTEVMHADRVGKSFVFDYHKNRFVFTDGRNDMTTQIKAIEQWIELFIRTEIEKYRIYTDTFGTNLNDLIGWRFPRSGVVSMIKQQITDGIMNKVPCIVSVYNWRFDAGTFYFTVKTNTGEEVEVQHEFRL